MRVMWEGIQDGCGPSFDAWLIIPMSACRYLVHSPRSRSRVDQLMLSPPRALVLLIVPTPLDSPLGGESWGFCALYLSPCS
jgi:hypothetical protein